MIKLRLPKLRHVLCLLVVASLGALSCASPIPSATNELILATTTSTRDSGLLDVLLPEFEKETGYFVKPIAVGSGQAIAMGARGEADVLLVHSPDAEREFMAAGHGVARQVVMYNDFVLLGPSSDPARVKDGASAARRSQGSPGASLCLSAEATTPAPTRVSRRYGGRPASIPPGATGIKKQAREWARL